MGEVIQGWLRDNVERPVTFRKLDVSWGEGVRLEDLRVGSDVPGDPPLLAAPQVVLRMPLLPALFKDLRVEEFEIVDPVVTVVRRDDGTMGGGDVLRKQRKRRRPRAGEAPAPEAPGSDPTAPAAPEEATAYPDIRVPVRVKNLTLVVRDAEGREARKTGIAFAGELTTRDGPSTFTLDVPEPGGAGLHVEGTAVLFDAEGILLTPDAVRVKSVVTAKSIDAAANADLLALFLERAPRAGVLDAKVEVDTVGRRGTGAADVRLRGFSLRPGDGDAGDGGGGGAAPSAAAPDDLTIVGRWDLGAETLRVEGLRVRADGLALDADVAGPRDALGGRATLVADFGRMTDALRAMGFRIGQNVTGTAAGEMTFDPAERGGMAGRFLVSDLNVSGRGKDRPPVAVGRVEATFRAVRDERGALRIDAAEARLPDLLVSVTGTRSRRGTLDLAGTAKGDLGGLLGRVRDLGLLPSEFGVNGTLDAAFRVLGNPGRAGEDGLVVDVERAVLTEDDVRIEAQARFGPDVLDAAATGEGDLGRLLGRAAAAGAPGGGASQAVRGRFAFDAAATGTPGAPSVRVSRFEIDGDLDVAASGELRPDGGLDAKVHAEGPLADAFTMLRRLGLLPEGVSLDGALRADAVLRGTREKPEVPEFSVDVQGRELTLVARGSVDAERRVTTTVTGAADLARVTDVVRRSGLAPACPPLTGRLEIDAEAAGPSDNVALPKFRALLRGGALDAEVTASVAPSGRVAGKVVAGGDVAALARIAHEAGWTANLLQPPGRLSFEATVGGTRNQVQVPSAVLLVEGPLTVTAKGSLDPAEMMRASVDVKGALQPVLDAAAAWRGTTPHRLDGTIEATVSVDGPRRRLVAAAPRVAVRSGSMSIEARGGRDADGRVDGAAVARGAIADVLGVLRAFGVAEDFRATGTIDATAEGRLADGVAEGSFSAVATSLEMTEPSPGGEPFREPRVSLTLSRGRYHVAERRLEPATAVMECQGARIDTTVERAGGAGGVLRAYGRFFAEATFAERHPGLLSGVRFRRVEGPFRFEGDVSGGRANAASWTGGADLEVATLTAPHVSVESAKAKALLEGGSLLLDPIEGAVNGGTVNGTARIGIAGERPSHGLELTATGVRLDAELAPLVARASPLFAIGESGSTGGKVSIDLRLTGVGASTQAVKKSLAGGGTLTLDGAFVESSQLVGAILSLVGGSGRMDFQKATVPFEVRDGHVRTGELAMDATGLLMRLGGEVGLDGKLDYGLRLKPTKGSPAAAFEKYAKILDKDGFLPLRIEGRLGKPKLRAPDVKDALKGQLSDLLGGLLGKDDDKDEEPPPPERPKGGGRKKRSAEAPTKEEEDVPPPPPPRGTEDEPPPPPPPSR
jgi:hypothetical protein